LSGPAADVVLGKSERTAGHLLESNKVTEGMAICEF